MGSEQAWQEGAFGFGRIYDRPDETLGVLPGADTWGGDSHESVRAGGRFEALLNLAPPWNELEAPGSNNRKTKSALPARWLAIHGAPGPVKPPTAPPIPEAVLMYCMPSSSNVTGAPRIPEPVWNDHSSSPLPESNAMDLLRPPPSFIAPHDQ